MASLAMGMLHEKTKVLPRVVNSLRQLATTNGAIRDLVHRRSRVRAGGRCDFPQEGGLQGLFGILGWVRLMPRGWFRSRLSAIRRQIALAPRRCRMRKSFAWQKPRKG